MSWWAQRDGTIVDYDGTGPVEDDNGEDELPVGASPIPIASTGVHDWWAA